MAQATGTAARAGRTRQPKRMGLLLIEIEDSAAFEARWGVDAAIARATAVEGQLWAALPPGAGGWSVGRYRFAVSLVGGNARALRQLARRLQRAVSGTDEPGEEGDAAPARAAGGIRVSQASLGGAGVTGAGAPGKAGPRLCIGGAIMPSDALPELGRQAAAALAVARLGRAGAGPGTPPRRVPSGVVIATRPLVAPRHERAERWRHDTTRPAERADTAVPPSADALPPDRTRSAAATGEPAQTRALGAGRRAALSRVPCAPTDPAAVTAANTAANIAAGRASTGETPRRRPGAKAAQGLLGQPVLSRSGLRPAWYRCRGGAPALHAALAAMRAVPGLRVALDWPMDAGAAVAMLEALLDGTRDDPGLGVRLLAEVDSAALLRGATPPAALPVGASTHPSPVGSTGPATVRSTVRSNGPSIGPLDAPCRTRHAARKPVAGVPDATVDLPVQDGAMLLCDRLRAMGIALALDTSTPEPDALAAILPALKPDYVLMAAVALDTRDPRGLERLAQAAVRAGAAMVAYDLRDARDIGLARRADAAYLAGTAIAPSVALSHLAAQNRAGMT
ncbi:MAG: hypothetical protein AAF677_12870 [Pseudomonadota bacterium]